MDKTSCLLAFAVFSALSASDAATTINASHHYSYGANIGWMEWLADSAADGVAVNEFVCSGWIYGANVGWINTGNGNPVNHFQYQNNSATDFGVNVILYDKEYELDPSVGMHQQGFALLRGYAYGANIGWINFEVTGNPRISLFTGRLTGYAYSANCGWINLDDMAAMNANYVQTDHILMGADADGDGIADGFEYLYFGNTTTANGTSDTDHDGISDKQEYLDGTSPVISTDRLRITAFATNSGGTSSPITWTSTTARLYVIETKPDLLAAMWDLDPTYGMPFAPDTGTSTTRTVTAANAAKRFYRVKSFRPLP